MMPSIGTYSFAGLFLAGAYYLFNGGEQDKFDTFNQPADIAIHKITHKKRIVNGTGLGSLKIKSSPVADGKLPITILRAGNHGHFTCHVTVADIAKNQSRVATDCTQENAKDSAITGIGEKALALVVREHVSAAIESREYNIDMVADQMISLAASNAFTIAQSSNLKVPD